MKKVMVMIPAMMFMISSLAYAGGDKVCGDKAAGSAGAIGGGAVTQNRAAAD